jgi:hypothetical protein
MGKIFKSEITCRKAQTSILLWHFRLLTIYASASINKPYPSRIIAHRPAWFALVKGAPITPKRIQVMFPCIY